MSHLDEDLFIKYINDQCTQEEIKFLLDSFKLRENEMLLKQVIKESLERNEHFMQATPVDLNDRLTRVYQKIQDEILADNLRESEETVVRRSWSFVAKAAAVVAFISLGLYFFRQDNTKNVISKRAEKVRAEEEITPGENKAILKLANGSEIQLDKANSGLLAREGQSQITKTEGGELVYQALQSSAVPQAPEMNTIIIPRGGQYQITLSDGTKVWLNAASSLTFPSFFAGEDREVELVGEAYFEVAKNAKMPFRVKSGAQTVEVLGTHFNINSYEDEASINTTLLEGRVRVTHSSTDKSVLLMPGQQSRLKQRIKVQSVDTDQVVAWKNGLISFESADIRNIMRQISRWYDVNVVFEGNIPHRSFTGKISRNSNLSEILDVLRRSRIDFRVQGRMITVLP